MTLKREQILAMVTNILLAEQNMKCLQHVSMNSLGKKTAN